MLTDSPRVTLRPPQPEGGWSTDILDLPNAVVVPPVKGGIMTECGVLRSDGSPEQRAAMWRRDRPLTLPPQPPQQDLPFLPGKWLWGGVMFNHFGHFLTESTGRLWGLDAHPDVAGMLFTHRRAVVAPLEPWQQEFFRHAGCTGDLRVLSKPMRVEQLIVPGQGFGLGRIIRGTAASRRHFASFADTVVPEGGDRLYISRSALSLNKGLLIGEHEMENRLVEHGYEIFHPQRHPLSVQLARYKAADHIIAAEGSAIHLFAMVARPHQRFAMIVRRRSFATELIVDHLRSFGSIEPTVLDSLSRTWARPNEPSKCLALGELNLPKLQKMLADAGFIASDGPDWVPLDEKTVLSRIGPTFMPRNVA